MSTVRQFLLLDGNWHVVKPDTLDSITMHLGDKAQKKNVDNWFTFVDDRDVAYTMPLSEIRAIREGDSVILLGDHT